MGEIEKAASELVNRTAHNQTEEGIEGFVDGFCDGAAWALERAWRTAENRMATSLGTPGPTVATEIADAIRRIGER